MKEEIAWLGLDVHVRSCALAWIDDTDKRREHWSFATSAENLLEFLARIPARQIHLCLEECGMSRWLADAARPYVAKVVFCDPKANKSISNSPKKSDKEDAYELARLFRLGGLKEVWQCQDMDRVVFKSAVQAYLASVDQHVRQQLQLKAHYRQWGVLPLGQGIYTEAGARSWLERIPHRHVREQLSWLHEAVNDQRSQVTRARRHMCLLGRAHPETARLNEVPGVGRIGAHVFVGLIQDPSRFARAQQLYRFCRLGIRDQSSDGKPLGYQRLDRNGRGELKAISYRAWMTNMRLRQGPVYEFHQQSLARTGNRIHARLNTQRKVLDAMWRMWLHEKPFDEKRFLGKSPLSDVEVKCG